MLNIARYKKHLWPRDSRTIFSVLLLIASLAVYLRLAIILLNGPDFQDETEKLVGAWMIHDGMRLYKDMFDHHGPFSYIIAHLFYAVTGSRDVANYRLIPLAFSLLSLFAILRTSAIQSLSARLIAASLMALGLAATQANYGLMLGMYQIYAGHLLVCALSLLIVPVILDKPVSRMAAFLGGLALGFVFFSAYSFVVACAFFGLICLYKAWLEKNWAHVKMASLGLLTSIVVVISWLLMFGDVIGYIVHHFYFNQVVYSKFVSYDPFLIFHFVPPLLGYWTLDSASSLEPRSYLLAYIIASAISVFSLLLMLLERQNLAKRHWKFIPVFICLLLGIVFSNPRAANDFQASTMVIVVVAFSALSFSVILDRNTSRRSSIFIASSVMIAILAVTFILTQFLSRTLLYSTLPSRYYGMTGVLKKSNSPDMEFLRSIVAPDEPVQQFPYNLMFYIAIDRNPASGNYYYLPWQDAYEKKPLWGYKIDVCQDMETKLPKIIYYSKSVVWVYPTSDYLGCVERLLDTKYLRTTRAENVWIRADVAAGRDDIMDASIVPQDFDASWLPDTERKRIEKAKMSFKKLALATDGLCLQKPKKPPKRQPPLPLEVGDCAATEAMELAARTTSVGQDIVALFKPQCLEIVGSSVEDGAFLRLWPCQGVPNQYFTPIPSGTGFRLQADHSRKCLGYKQNVVMQMDCAKAPIWQWK